ncbi:maternal protein exuperantia [Neocloeon triangulifer]|uniref:maternal protein exuperantia n=1 Tax=Neocloeon triangulifer TaxID=2078957 RepID=UPI00286F6E97|nr:maternal protein exuperantia [Neocloeon triangulifer]
MTSEIISNTDSKFALPAEGNFKVVTYDIMTTGSSLADDLCSIVAYSPADDKSFTQHIMPYNNLSLGACRRYSLRIVSNGRYRVLKDVRNNKVLETKSDYMALLDFLEFLRSVKGDSDGLILLAHDSRKFFCSLLLDVITKVHLRDEFCALVKAFANSYAIAEVKCAKPGRSLSLRTLATSLLTAEGQELNLADRAKTAYLLTSHIFETEQAEAGAGDQKMTPEMVSVCLRPFTVNMDGVDKETSEIVSFRKREESLLPLFTKMRNNRNDRQRSFMLLRLLAHSNIDYCILSDIYQKGGMDAIQEVLKCTMDKEHTREIEELKHVFAMHFDPEYKGQFKPEPLPSAERPANNKQGGQGNGRRFYRRRNSNNKKTGKRNSESQPSSPTEDVTPVAILITDENETTVTVAAL